MTFPSIHPGILNLTLTSTASQFNTHGWVVFSHGCSTFKCASQHSDVSLAVMGLIMGDIIS